MERFLLFAFLQKSGLSRLFKTVYTNKNVVFLTAF